MNVWRTHLLLLPALFLFGNCLYAGEFQTVEINKSNEKSKSNGYFSFGPVKRADNRVSFTVIIKANMEDIQVRSSLARLEIMKNGNLEGILPLHRLPRNDGAGHVIQFELTPQLAATSTLVLVQLTGDIQGTVFRVNLGTYSD